MKPFRTGFAFGSGVIVGGLLAFVGGIKALEWLERRGLRWPP